jgi:hypothetical protein
MYKIKAVIYTLHEEVVDFTTGLRVQTRQARKIDVVSLPQETLYKFYQDIAYLAANKNFTYGMFNVVGERVILVDSIKVTENDWFTLEHNRYQVKDIETLPHGQLVVLTFQKSPAPFETMMNCAASVIKMQGIANATIA